MVSCGFIFGARVWAERAPDHGLEPGSLRPNPDRWQPALLEECMTRRHKIDQVEEAGMDSFPASDPPAWAATSVGSPKRTGSKAGLSTDRDPREDRKPSTRSRKAAET